MVARSLEDKDSKGDSTTTVRDLSTVAKGQAINHKSPKSIQKNVSQVSNSMAHKSHRSHSITEEIEEPKLYSCYHKGCNYQIDDVQEYERHGAQKHLKNPLLYPSKAEIEKYGLKAQGKDWEI